MVMLKELESGWIGQVVRVHRNLQNHRMTLQGQGPNGWRVIGHVTEATLKDVVFVISAAGKARARRNVRRNVHAWGQGILVDGIGTITPIPLYYDTYKTETFTAGDLNGQPVYRARWLAIKDNKPWLSQDALHHPADRWEDAPPQLTLFSGVTYDQHSKLINLLRFYCA